MLIISILFRMVEDIDFFKSKRTYPRTINDSIVEFVFEPDPNLYMRKNNIQIFGTIEIPDICTPDVGFAMKMFSMLTIEVNSQLVSNNRNQLVISIIKINSKCYLEVNINIKCYHSEILTFLNVNKKNK